MNGLERITRLLLEGGSISAQDAETARAYFSREREMRAMAEKFVKEKKMPCQSAAEKLAVTLSAADIARVRYAELGIPQDIYFDTMSDIGVWAGQCRAQGGEGLENTPWLAHHVRLELFKLGRLQFQPIKRPVILNMGLACALRLRKLPEMCLNVHIPRGGRLDRSACEAALYGAPMFFKKYFAAEYTAFFCLSWLLYPGNEKFMDKKSNILAFAKLFDPAGSCKSNGDTLYYLFGSRRIDPEKTQAHTSLQKAALEYYKKGGRFGLGCGVKNL